MVLSEKISLLRAEKGFKVAQLAEMTNVSDDAIRSWERGMRIPELDNLIKLADAFDVSLDIFRQDTTNLSLPHPKTSKTDDSGDDSTSYCDIPLRFGSSFPNEKQKQILDFCNDYLETLDGEFFVKGTGQNSEYGTGRYFWESKIDLLLFIGYTPSFLQSHSEYALSICINTEKRLSEAELSEFNVLQITDSKDENWIYAPIRCVIEKQGGLYTKQLREETDTALVTVMKIARKSLEIKMSNFIMNKANINHTKQSAFAE